MPIYERQWWVNRTARMIKEKIQAHQQAEAEAKARTHR